MKITTYQGVEMTQQESEQFSFWLNKYFSEDFGTLNTFYKNQSEHIINKWLEFKRGEVFYSPVDTAKIIYDSIPEWDGVNYKD